MIFSEAATINNDLFSFLVFWCFFLCNLKMLQGYILFYNIKVCIVRKHELEY